MPLEAEETEDESLMTKLSEAMGVSLEEVGFGKSSKSLERALVLLVHVSFLGFPS